MGTVTTLPVWKINTTPAELLMEITRYAEDCPDDVKNLHLIWEDEDGEINLRCSGAQTMKNTIGLIEMAKCIAMGLHTHDEAGK